MGDPALGAAHIGALGRMTGPEAARWLEAGFEDHPARTAQILAELKQAAVAEGAGGGPYHRAYDHAMEGLARLENSALRAGRPQDVREFLQATAQLGPEAAGFTADVVWMQAQQLAGITSFAFDRRAETAHILHREIATMISSDPVGVLRGLHADRQALDGILGSMLRYSDSGAGEQIIRGMVVDTVTELRDAISRGDVEAARRAGAAGGFLIGELGDAIRSVAAHSKDDVERAAAIVEYTIKGVIALAGLLGADVRAAEEPLLKVLDLLKKVENGEVAAGAADLQRALQDAFGAGVHAVLQKAGASEELDNAVNNGLDQGWGASQGPGSLDVGRSRGPVPWSDSGYDGPPGETAAALDLSATDDLLGGGSAPAHVDGYADLQPAALAPDLSEVLLSALPVERGSEPVQGIAPGTGSTGPDLTPVDLTPVDLTPTDIGGLLPPESVAVNPVPEGVGDLFGGARTQLPGPMEWGPGTRTVDVQGLAGLDVGRAAGAGPGPADPIFGVIGGGDDVPPTWSDGPASGSTT